MTKTTTFQGEMFQQDQDQLLIDSVSTIDLDSEAIGRPLIFIGGFFVDTNGNQVTPTSGTLTIAVETSNSPGYFEPIRGGKNIDVTAPLPTVNFEGNVERIRVTPSNISGNGVTNLHLIITANSSGSAGFSDDLAKYSDAFGKFIADGTTNELDIGSHYPYNPERWRLFVDGTRVFPEYGSVSQYNHAGDVHELMPAAGETVILQTSERSSYVVQYEQEATFALNINQALQAGDRIRFGPFNDNDGWFLEQNGDSHNSNQCDLIIKRNGTNVKVKSNQPLSKSLLDFVHYSNKYSWYNVGPSLSRQFFTEGNKGKRQDIGSISVDDGGRGPMTGNVPLRYEVTASGSTTGLKLNAGSVALVTLGQVTPVNRVKGADFVDNIGTADTWVPIRAFRLSPDKNIVLVKLLELTALLYDADFTVRIQAQVFEAENVTFTGDDTIWETPGEWLSANNALETRNDITGIPDNTGTIVANTDDPGGYQVGRSILIPISGQYQKGTSTSDPIEQKRTVPQGSYLVILGKAGGAGNVTYDFNTEQNF